MTTPNAQNSVTRDTWQDTADLVCGEIEPALGPHTQLSATKINESHSLEEWIEALQGLGKADAKR
ncbi:MAG TPA: hypothetical protein VEW48_03010 [Thermoanaerobaculia bacterium]|nr:hypothetical protein [Thermoanaerobaculia bacterium]